MAKKVGDKKTVASLEAKIRAPDLDVGMALYVNAFIDLDSEREWLAQIPWTSIVRYCEFYGLSQGQTEDMIAYIRAVDNEVLKGRAADQRNAARRSE